MTIIASVKVRDGVVLGTDSMTQISARLPNGQFAVIKAYRNARKLFQLENLPVGVMSWGAGNIGSRSIEGCVLDFVRDMRTYVADQSTVRAIAQGLFSFVSGLYDEAHKGAPNDQRPVMGFLVAGYSDKGKFAEEFEFVLPASSDVSPVRPPEGFGSSWRGANIPFGRLYFGFDPRVPQELESLGVDKEILQKVFGSGKWNLPFVYDGMPLKDAVNHATFILRTTIETAAYEAGPAPICGGPIQVAVILPSGQWVWVHEPKLGD